MKRSTISLFALFDSPACITCACTLKYNQDVKSIARYGLSDDELLVVLVSSLVKLLNGLNQQEFLKCEAGGEAARELSQRYWRSSDAVPPLRVGSCVKFTSNWRSLYTFKIVR